MWGLIKSKLYIYICIFSTSILVSSCSKIESFTKKSTQFSDSTNLLEMKSNSITSTTTSSTTVLDPSSLSATSISGNQINLSWIDNSNNETGFEIQYSLDASFTSNVSLVSTAAGITSKSVSGLLEATKYYFRVRATNGTNVSNFTASVNSTTLVNTPSTLSATVQSGSTSQINLSWADTSSVESGFLIQYSTDPAILTGIQTKSISANTTSTQITGLSANTTYYFKIQTTHATLPASAFTEIANAKTNANPTPPIAPSNLVALATSSSTINLSWTDNSSDETGFTIEQASSSAFSAPIVTTTYAANTTSTTINGLSASTTYFYRVKATNSVGSFAFSNVANATTQALAVVNPPTSITLTNPTTNPGKAANPTFSVSGNIVSGNTIRLYQKSGTTNCNTLVGTATATTTSVSIASTVALTTSGTYQYYATIQNASGTSACSTAFGSYTFDITPPNAPTSLSLNTPISSPTSLTAPIIQVGGVAAGDTVQIFANSNTCASTSLKGSATVGASATTVNVTSSTLTQGSYSFYAKSTDPLGNSSSCSTAVSPTLLIDTTAPTVSVSAPAANAILSGTTATISATAADTGGAGIQKVEFFAGTTLLGSDNTSPYSVTFNPSALTDGTINLSAKATDNAGNLTTSANISVTIQNGTAPAAPTNLTSFAPTSTSVSLTWTDNSNNETGFVLEQSSTSSFSTVSTINIASNVTGKDVGGLAPSTTYYYRIKATNSNGSSAYSNTATVTTQAASGGTTVNPLVYYNFDSATPGITTAQPYQNVCAASPSTVSSHCLLFSFYTAIQDIKANGPIGNYLQYKPNYGYLIGNNNTNLMSAPGSATIEMLMKPDPTIMNSQLFASGSGPGQIWIKFDFPNIKIETISHNSTGVAVSDTQDIPLTGIGIGSYSTLFDGNWHHIVVRFEGSSSTNAVKSFCIDGFCPTEWRKSIAQSTIQLGKNSFSMGNTAVQYVVPSVALDQVAIYGTSISNSFVYQHYLNFTSGQNYNFVDSGMTVPATPAIKNEVYDMAEFAPNTVLPTPLFERNNTPGSQANTPAAVPDAYSQLRSFPAPRYRTGNTMPYHFNWMNSIYMTGIGQVNSPTDIYTAGPILTKIEDELAQVWHYGHTLGTNPDTPNYVPQNNEWTYYQLPSINNPANAAAPLNFITFGQGYVYNNPNKPSGCYLQNASGQYLDQDSNVITGKITRRVGSASSSICPDSTWDDRIINFRNNILSTLQYVNKNVHIINENGEQIYKTQNTIVDGTTAQVDPVVKADYLASGLPNFKAYDSRWFGRINKRFGDVILAGASQSPKLANAKFTLYGQDGFNYYYDWSETRVMQTLMNGQRYATPDFYLQNPGWWHKDSVGFNHGLLWEVKAVHTQMQLGDKWFSPFISPGWFVSEEKNIRPGQWSGLVGSLVAMGAEFFYTGFFNAVSVGGGRADLQDPKNWIWQATIPSYIQAAVSKDEDLYRNSTLMPGDVPYSSMNGTDFTTPGYRFGATDPNIVVRVRKHNTLNKYMIFSTIQRHNNFDMPFKSAPVKIKLDGQDIQFMTRMQGSIYVYDKTVNPPTFKQLDSEIEYKHPSHWTKDFYIQAELPENNASGFVVKTSGAVGNDFRNATSSLTFTSIATSPTYKFTPRLDLANPNQTSRSYYTFIKARTNGSAGNLSIHLDNGTALKTISVSNTNVGWCRVEGSSQSPLINVSFGAAGSQTFPSHEIKLTPASTSLEIDEFLITTNGSANPTPYIGYCAAGT